MDKDYFYIRGMVADGSSSQLDIYYLCLVFQASLEEKINFVKYVLLTRADTGGVEGLKSLENCYSELKSALNLNKI